MADGKRLRSGKGTGTASDDQKGAGSGSGVHGIDGSGPKVNADGQNPGTLGGGPESRVEAVLREGENSGQGHPSGTEVSGMGDRQDDGRQTVSGRSGEEQPQPGEGRKGQEGSKAKGVKGKKHGRPGVPCGSGSEGIHVESGGIINESALLAIEEAMRNAEEAVSRVMKTIRTIKPVFERMLAFEEWGSVPSKKNMHETPKPSAPQPSSWSPSPGLFAIRGVPGATLPTLYPGGVRGSAFVKWDGRGEPLVAELTYDGNRKVWFEIERAGDVIGTLWTEDAGMVAPKPGEPAGVGSGHAESQGPVRPGEASDRPV